MAKQKAITNWNLSRIDQEFRALFPGGGGGWLYAAPPPPRWAMQGTPHSQQYRGRKTQVVLTVCFPTQAACLCRMVVMRHQ